MLKIIILLVLPWLIWWLIKKPRKKIINPKENANMVACTVCGVYVPKGDSLTKNGRFYCCIEHLKEGS